MKRKIIMYISTSLDGFIADENGSVDFINNIPKVSTNDGVADYENFFSTIDTVLMGKTTYNQIITTLSPHAWPYKHTKTYVFSNEYHENSNDIYFVKNDIEEFAKNLKKEDGKNIWLLGGARLANEFIKKNLVDEYHLYIIPVFLGEGIKLFYEGISNKLELVLATKVDAMAKLVYKKREKII